MIDLLELSAEIRSRDAEAAAAARTQAGPTRDELDDLTEWWAGVTGSWPVTPPRRVRLALTEPPFAAVGDLAAGCNVGTRILMAHTDAPTALTSGAAAADEEIDSGADLLLVAASGTSAASLVLISLFTGVEPVALLPRGAAAADTAGWIELAEAVRDGRRETASLRHQPGRLLEALDSPELAAVCGFVLRSIGRRTPLLLEGTAALAAALLAADLHRRAGDWWQAADSSPDPGQGRVVQHLERKPVLDLRTGTGRGTAALLVLSVLRAAIAEATGASDE